MNFKLRAFRAIDEPETCGQYLDEHLEVLRIFGITKITSANDDWLRNPSCYVIIAEDPKSGQIVGGIRVQQVGGTQPLPVEDAIGFMDSAIHLLVKDHHFNRGAGELCGLWNARSVAGLGLSKILIRAGLSITNQLGIKTMFGICAELTLPMFKSVGYEIEESLGNCGTFYYPNEDLVAYALIMDANSLPQAEEIERSIVLKLRESPIIRTVEIGPKGEMEVEYEL